MSFFRYVLILCVITAFTALALLFFGAVKGYEKFNGGYAVINVDTQAEEIKLLELLKTKKNNLTGNPISESTQWVLLDEFGSIEKIPLDKYSQRILPFDPRNDGYAEKLKNIFQSNGKRNIYIPLNALSWNIQALDKNFKELLKDIPFSADYYGITEPVYLYFIFYLASSAGFLIIYCVKKKSFNRAINIFPLMPVLSALSFFGTSGIVSAGIIFGFFILMKEPLGDIVKIFSSLSVPNAKIFDLLYREVLKPYKMYLPVLPLFLFSLVIIVVFSQVKPLFLFAAFTCTLIVYLFSCKTASFLNVNKKRFNPVLIIKSYFPDFSSLVCVLPFALFAFLAIFFTPYITGGFVSNEKYNMSVGETDYREHLIYQAAFSTRSLNASDAGYQNYFFDEDGLVSGEMTTNEISVDEFPPFPLKQLTDFFNNVNSAENKNNFSGSEKTKDGICISILLILIMLGFFIRTENNNAREINFEDLNKFKSNNRFKGINRNKSIMYNNKNELRIRRDA